MKKRRCGGNTHAPLLTPYPENSTWTTLAVQYLHFSHFSSSLGLLWFDSTLYCYGISTFDDDFQKIKLLLPRNRVRK